MRRSGSPSSSQTGWIRRTTELPAGVRGPYHDSGRPDHRIAAARNVLGLVALKYSRLQLAAGMPMDRLTELLHRGEADPAVRHLVRVVQQIYANVKSSDDVKRLDGRRGAIGIS